MLSLIRVGAQSSRYSQYLCQQDHIESPKFDVASDSFSSLKDLLTRHKVLVAEYLEKYYESVCDVVELRRTEYLIATFRFLQPTQSS
mmetsp:Transcript_50560/g.130329  ORF Transcript_50560/g.130329 Transcript_50560/m.130329 type:complete len:87 (-) Transcript_50560:2345-2605(-)